ncbi:TetR/AcrR family transcriptional regulator [Maribacter polysiphoniae]|uniref:TetR family transcriptional regulator n=1 Tax=Maribacter polysiphoniae TaxID=429344 RepID=A0A316E8I9_9FLAO|nr:TetR/AcrR family transcriptional regulator [Maribacter polysiphoniae]MBD1260388.1 TetR/AcrR family transcriptional regulator [Maribacter polysiphoniae]PWK25852.1 TetR family transcriptional regulator [Maribacter polysiphoniae]
MDRLLQSVKININEKIYVKDPESSDLGRRIIEESILMIHDMGFESFTFKKLGVKIGSNESSIYRYFENKHKLLLYLASWYWGWLEYQLVFATNSISNPKEKLEKTIEIVTKGTEEDSSFSHINEVLLNKIVINEYSKSYLTKEIDAENKEGYFIIYKRLVTRISDMIKAIDADYPYASSLASTILEGSLHQYFLRDHFPSLTDCHAKNAPTAYFLNLVFSILIPKTK